MKIKCLILSTVVALHTFTDFFENPEIHQHYFGVDVTECCYKPRVNDVLSSISLLDSLFVIDAFALILILVFVPVNELAAVQFCFVQC